MRKIDNKGFTLIELIAVLIILVTITLIAVPSISSALSRSKKKQYDAKKELIISATELYYSDHNLPKTGCIKVSTLVDNDYLSSESIENPNTNAPISGSVRYNSQTKTFELKLGVDCSN